MKTPRLETDRLILREIQEQDTKDIFNCWMNDNAVSKYMWWKASDDIADTERFVKRELDNVENAKWYRWLLILRDSQELAGTVLLYWNDEDAAPHWDISYNLGKKYWGKGYTTEAVKRVLEFAKSKLGISECITSYAKVNLSSANVLHKLGFEDIGDIQYECSKGEFITEGSICKKTLSND